MAIKTINGVYRTGLSYAGVSLLSPTQEVIDQVESLSTLDLIPEFDTNSWQNNLDHLLIRCPDLAPDKLQLSVLHWPTQAARFAYGHFLIDGNMRDVISPLAFSSTGPTAQLLNMGVQMTDPSDMTNAIPGLAVNMYALPIRKVLGTPSGNSLYLLTLVDARYFWWQKYANITVNPGVTTWDDLITQIATGLGVIVSPATINANYQKPSSRFNADGQPLPLLMDAVCFQIGQRLIANLDGTFTTQNYSDALTVANTLPQSSNWNLKSGGAFSSTELTQSVPESVTVMFSRTDSGVSNTTPYADQVTLTSLAIPAFSGVTGYDGSKVIVADLTATFTLPSDTTPTNNAAVTAVADQTATDWYNWQLGRVSVTYWNFLPVTMSGLYDFVEWSYKFADTQDISGVHTRIQRTTFNDRISGQTAYSAPSASLTVEDDAGSPVVIPNVNTIELDHIFFNLSNPSTQTAYISSHVLQMAKNSGSFVGPQPKLRVTEGSGVTLTLTEDTGANELDLTISATGSYTLTDSTGTFAIVPTTPVTPVTEQRFYSTQFKLTDLTGGVVGISIDPTIYTLKNSTGTFAIANTTPVTPVTEMKFYSTQFELTDLGSGVAGISIVASAIYTLTVSNGTFAIVNTTPITPVSQIKFHSSWFQTTDLGGGVAGISAIGSAFYPTCTLPLAITAGDISITNENQDHTTPGYAVLWNNVDNDPTKVAQWTTDPETTSLTARENVTLGVASSFNGFLELLNSTNAFQIKMNGPLPTNSYTVSWPDDEPTSSFNKLGLNVLKTAAGNPYMEWNPTRVDTQAYGGASTAAGPIEWNRNITFTNDLFVLRQAVANDGTPIIDLYNFTQYALLVSGATRPAWTLTPQVKGPMTIGISSTQTGELKLANSSNTNLVSIVSGVTGTAATRYILPAAIATAGQILSADTVVGADVTLKWIAASSGGSLTVQLSGGGSAITGVTTLSFAPASSFTVTGSTPNATVTALAATASISGLVSTSAQSMAGIKSFQDGLWGANVGGSYIGLFGSSIRYFDNATATNVDALQLSYSAGVLTLNVQGGAGIITADKGIINKLSVGNGYGSTGQVLSSNGAGTAMTWITAGTGTVTSFSSGNIGSIITASVATATTTPALSFSIATQSANTVWAGPTSGGASAPTFRALVSADLPTITLTGDVTGAASAGSIATTIANGAVTNAKLANSSITIDGTAVSLGGTVTRQIAIFCDQKSSGTAAGSAASGAWRTRTLNTTISNTITGCTLGSNQITLPAGTYRFSASAPAFATDQHQTRFRNTTDSTETTGTSEYSRSGASSNQTRSVCVGVVTIGSSKIFELQHQFTTTSNTNGLGVPASFGTEEYAFVEIEKIG